MKKTNDIDVSKCPCFDDECCYAEPILCSDVEVYGYRMCCECPNCLYRQLQNKTKECEELKEKLKTLDEEILTVEVTLEEYEQLQYTKEKHEEYKNTLTQLKKKIEEVL
jgi:hypothetical protein